MEQIRDAVNEEGLAVDVGQSKPKRPLKHVEAWTSLLGYIHFMKSR